MRLKNNKKFLSNDLGFLVLAAQDDVKPFQREERAMDFGLGILTFGTLGFVVAFGFISARVTEKYRQSNPPKSSLSRDGIEERMAAASKA